MTQSTAVLFAHLGNWLLAWRENALSEPQPNRQPRCNSTPSATACRRATRDFTGRGSIGRIEALVISVPRPVYGERMPADR